MTMSTRHRGRFGRRLAATAAAASMAFLSIGGTAGATAPGEAPEQITPTLPTPGETYDLAMSTEGAELTIDGQTVTTGPLEGSVTFTIEENADPLAGSVVAKASEFTLAGESEELGKVTIEQSDLETTAESLLKLTKGVPPTFEHALFVGLTITIENPPQASASASAPAEEQAGEPLVLTTKNPVQLEATLDQFPPQGGVYQLKNPVDLVVPGRQDAAPSALLGGLLGGLLDSLLGGILIPGIL